MVNLFGGSIFICSYLIYDGFQSSSTYDQKRQISASALKAYKLNFLLLLLQVIQTEESP